MSHQLPEPNHSDSLHLHRQKVKHKLFSGGLLRIAVIAGCLIAAAVLLRFTQSSGVLGDLFMMKKLPQLEAGASFGMILVVGLLTSVHCVGMCGGIAVSQSLRTGREQRALQPAYKRYAPSVRYNLGRIVSYTAIGGIAGGIGSVVQITGIWRGLIPLFGGLFMVIMGINLLGVFKALRRLNLRMPAFAAKKILGGAGKLNPFGVGLLSGLMPCGPLQIIQLYALGTGSVLYGALSALVFSLGTVPALFLFGVVNTVFSKRAAGSMMKVSAILVIVLGGVMFNRGLALSGIGLLPREAHVAGHWGIAQVEQDGGRQTVAARASANSYPPIVVQKGVPVTWNLQVDEGDLNNCNNSIVIPEFHLEQKLAPGDNLIRFTPLSEGSYLYTCWMGMIKGTILVVDDIGRYLQEQTSGPDAAPAADGNGDGGRSGSLPAAPTARASDPAVASPGTAAAAAGGEAPAASEALSAKPAAAPSTLAEQAPTAEQTAAQAAALEQAAVQAITPEQAPTAGHPSAAGQGAAPKRPAAPVAAADQAATAPVTAVRESAPPEHAGMQPKAAASSEAEGDPGTAVINSGGQMQTAVTLVSSGGYTPITVHKGIAVRWTIRVSEDQLNECNDTLIVPAFALRKDLAAGDNILEFTPLETGEFPFTCWMEMIESKITVVEALPPIDERGER
ncbi:MAG: hypothetical protein K0R57_2885 [Paenibacillaceae bacterium]|jgi:sulfite exporter TauE/SafE/plastocyanin domain-containing protein|nr:hypothetical protein [Paenibacillaceae bacterium]